MAPPLRSVRHGSQFAFSVAEAHRLLAAGLAGYGLGAADLTGTPGSEPRKVALASEIWEKTTVNLQWIADHLAMRSAANTRQQIRRWRVIHGGQEAILDNGPAAP